MHYISGYDLERTVREYDFTRKAILNIDRVISSEDFEDMDSSMIFQYLVNGMNLLSFKDHLKRYLYKRSGLKQNFSEVTDDVYKEIIKKSFQENEAPYSMEPVQRRVSVIIRSWLTGDKIKRNSLFVIGFGLQMSDRTVSEFLKKVLYEEDFDIRDPREAVFCYCFRKSLPYKMAESFLQYYEKLDPDRDAPQPDQQTRWETMLAGRRFDVSNDMEMVHYLQYLKSLGYREEMDIAYREFTGLVFQAREIIAEMYRSDYLYAGRDWTSDMITAADIEKVLCSGIPVDQSGNLKKMSSSTLSSHFQNKRMSRQRLERLLKRKSPVNRFDIITLEFFITASRLEDEYPDERCRTFIDRTNEILEKCGFTGIYPVNPYETFVLLCLLTEFPIASYADIWEMSYENQQP